MDYFLASFYHRPALVLSHCTSPEIPCTSCFKISEKFTQKNLPNTCSPAIEKVQD